MPYSFPKLLLFIFLGLCNLSIHAESQYWNKGRGYDAFDYATPEGILIENPTDTLRYSYMRLEEPQADFVLKFRANNINSAPSKKYVYTTNEGKNVKVSNPHWGFFVTSNSDTIVFSAQGIEQFNPIGSSPGLKIETYDIPASTKETITISRNINPYTGDNLWTLELKDNVLHLSGGISQPETIINLDCKEIEGFGFFAGWGAKVLISDVEIIIPDKNVESNLIDVENLEEYLNESVDPMEGIWILFDRELEENLLKTGGDYRLACVKQNEGYALYYIEGGRVNSRQWRPGEIKALLFPTPFTDIFEVEWIDAMKMSMKNDIKAQKGDGETLLIQFPYQSSKIRLRKLPSPSASGSTSSGPASSKSSSQTTSKPASPSSGT